MKRLEKGLLRKFQKNSYNVLSLWVLVQKSILRAFTGVISNKNQLD